MTTPMTPAPNTITPAPWAPYTRAGCDAGYVGTANVELENTAVDIPKVSGPNWPGAATARRSPGTTVIPDVACTFRQDRSVNSPGT